MRHRLWGVVAGAVGIVMTCGLPSSAAEAVTVADWSEASIVVRTYTQPGSQRDLRTAHRTASDILGRARIRVAWIECGSPGARATVDICAQPLRPHELVVRIVSSAAADSRGEAGALGFAFVDPQTGEGWLATVYADRVERMAQAAGAQAAEVLGRAMAHEIGHLLLGSNQHAPHGVMRASWTGADLRRNRATQWLFAGKEGEVMRRRIASRQGWGPWSSMARQLMTTGNGE